MLAEVIVPEEMLKGWRESRSADKCMHEVMQLLHKIHVMQLLQVEHKVVAEIAKRLTSLRYKLQVSSCHIKNLNAAPAPRKSGMLNGAMSTFQCT